MSQLVRAVERPRPCRAVVRRGEGRYARRGDERAQHGCRDLVRRARDAGGGRQLGRTPLLRDGADELAHERGRRGRVGEGRPPSRRKDLRGRARALLRPFQRPPVGFLDGLLRARHARGPDGQHRRDPPSLLLGLRGRFLGVPGGRHEGDLALLASAKSRRGAGRDLELGQLGESGPLPGAVPVERRGVRRGGDGGEGGPLRLRMGRGGHRGTPRELLQRPRHVGADVLPERRRRARRGHRLYEPPHGAGARAGGELPVAEVVSGGADADG